ncbi:hypothetical protein STAN_7084 [Streptomyces sp. CBMAI 2042]|nr:hypothetical protein STAN_7084 [Streptomyces sp. CBMAI 2042]
MAAPAHLRSRGEHLVLLALGDGADGSPPLARRAPHHAQAREPHDRLTSARAESTRPGRSLPSPRAALLRSRGEHIRPRRLGMAHPGSPPLARRALLRNGIDRVDDRLTSARAESTTGPCSTPYGSRAHLRSRGEHAEAPDHAVVGGGSPPLARRARRTR